MTVPVPTVGSKIRASFGTAVANSINNEGLWQSYTPAITGSTTDPVLGTGGLRLGKYVQVGDLVIVHVEIIWGSSGTSQGSGTYAVSLPVSAAGGLGGGGNPLEEVGTGSCSTGGGDTSFNVTMSSGGVLNFRWYNAAYNATSAQLAAGSPGTFSAGSYIKFHATYEAS